MRTPAYPLVVALTAELVAAGCGAEDRLVIENAAGLDVLFDERHGLSGGERVVFHDFDIGMVTSVDIHDARVRARLLVEQQVLEQLTEATTFTVEDGDGESVLEAHVLDPDAPRLSAGATLEGCDSAVELALRRAGASATKLFQLDREDEAEWQRQIDRAKERLGELAEESSEKAREAADELAHGIERLTEELENAGKSEEAKNLRHKLNELLEKLKESSSSSP